jgi:hypothetical protein
MFVNIAKPKKDIADVCGCGCLRSHQLCARTAHENFVNTDARAAVKQKRPAFLDAVQLNI